jgi:hypothetical protein
MGDSRAHHSAATEFLFGCPAAFVDERLSFSPRHALEDHRPLGGIMRSRLKAYEEAAKYRAQRNERERFEPSDIAAVPA